MKLNGIVNSQEPTLKGRCHRSLSKAKYKKKYKIKKIEMYTMK